MGHQPHVGGRPRGRAVHLFSHASALWFSEWWYTRRHETATNVSEQIGLIQRSRRTWAIATVGMLVAAAIWFIAQNSWRPSGAAHTPVSLRLQWTPQAQFAGYLNLGTTRRQGLMLRFGLQDRILNLRTPSRQEATTLESESQTKSLRRAQTTFLCELSPRFFRTPLTVMSSRNRIQFPL